jgi:hypothetical protein
MRTGIDVRHELDRSVSFLKDGALVLTYRYGDVQLFPYCHPVHAEGQVPLTIIRPGDHPWHHGLFFAWKYLNQHNVWEQHYSGERWGTTENVSMEVFRPERDGGAAGLVNEIRWTSSGGRPILSDVRTLVVRRDEVTGVTIIDCTFRFTPIPDEVVLERTVEWGGYAGLTVRFPRVLNGIVSAGAEGQPPEPSEGFTGLWADFSFTVDGLPATRPFEHSAGWTMMDHPSNRRHPTPWLAFPEGSVQLLQAALLRNEPLTLTGAESLTLSYRNCVHRGGYDNELTQAVYDDFTAVELPSR